MSTLNAQHRSRIHTRRQSVRGFSLVEAMMALAIVGLAASAMLLSTETTMTSSGDAVDRMIAQGIAEQMAAEILQRQYVEPGVSPRTTSLGLDAGEKQANNSRTLFDDTDDYHQYSTTALLDEWGVELGQGNDAGGLRTESLRVPATAFSGWQFTVDISYVDEANPANNVSANTPTGMRSLTISVHRDVNGSKQSLATLRRVFAYVAPPAL